MRLKTAVVSPLTLVSVAANGAEPRLTDVVPIPVRAGINTIASLAPDGRSGTVVLGWRDNGNAHGYDVFVVLLPTRAGGKDWNVVGFVPSNGENGALEDSIRDAPHEGDDVVRSVRFARGRVDGVDSTLVFVANRVIGGDGIPAPTPVDFTLYRLARGAEVGVTTDVFQIAGQWHTEARFCNAEIALTVAFRLPLRASYEGPKNKDGKPTPDGCP
jgi:hypothetical protein